MDGGIGWICCRYLEASQFPLFPYFINEMGVRDWIIRYGLTLIVEPAFRLASDKLFIFFSS